MLSRALNGIDIFGDFGDFGYSPLAVITSGVNDIVRKAFF